MARLNTTSDSIVAWSGSVYVLSVVPEFLVRFSLWLFTFAVVANREGMLSERLSINLVTFVVRQTFQKHDS